MATDTAATRELLARRRDIELEFVRRASNRVHIAVPADPDADDEVERPQTAEDKFQIMLALTRRVVPTMCGRTEHVYFSGDRDTVMLDTFSDNDLCAACRDALGEHAPRAFEHPQPGDTEPDD